MTMNFHKKPQRDFVFHFFLNNLLFLIFFIFFCSLFFPKQYWKVYLYYAFIDHMIMELESRLIKSENRFYAQYLFPRVIGNRSVSAKTRRLSFNVGKVTYMYIGDYIYQTER
jgi:hypothetical protein